MLLTLTSCVTIKMGPKEPEKASNLEFKEPNAPFEKLTSASADASWKHKKTGNIISLFSECSAGSESSLESLQGDAARALDEVKTEKDSRFDFNDREAQRTLYSGKIDGVKMNMEVVTLKKNSCSYIISLMGRKDRFESDTTTFESFLKGFKAP